MKKWLAIILVLVTLGLPMSVVHPPVVAGGLQQQMQRNQSELLGLWLQEESIIISQLVEIDRRLQFRMHPGDRKFLLDARVMKLQRLQFVKGQIYNISMQLYGRPRP